MLLKKGGEVEWDNVFMFNNYFITNVIYSDSMLNFLVNRGQYRTICGKRKQMQFCLQLHISALQASTSPIIL